MARIEIDEGSGFCFGVTTAIKKAEEELAKGGILYCLGDIVHNSREVAVLELAARKPGVQLVQMWVCDLVMSRSIYL